jgi:hypothetical protein
MPIISLLLGNWKLVLLGLLVAAVGYLNWRLESVKQARHKDAVAAEAIRIQLEGSLSAQNEAIAKLGKESADRKAKAPNAPTASECPAGEAVKSIREGLK